MKKITILLIIIALVIPTGNAYSRSLFGLTTQEEIVIGQKVARDIENKLPIYNNYFYQERVERVGKRIARVSDRRDLSYTFKVIDRPELNAFATFGGYIYIYKGAVDKASGDDELASILAHEIGHVSAKHLSRSVEKSRAFGLWFGLLDAFFLRKQKHRKDIYQMINIGYDIIQRGYSTA